MCYLILSYLVVAPEVAVFGFTVVPELVASLTGVGEAEGDIDGLGETDGLTSAVGLGVDVGAGVFAL